MRIYLIDTTFGYYGDQGRDLLEMQKWITTGNIPLIGPSTSVGEFHLGPLYFYLLAPFFIIFNGDPLGVVYLNIFGGFLLIILSTLLILKYIDKATAFFYLIFVTFSPHIISLSRGSWNPNLQPFLAVIIAVLVLIFTKKGKLIYIFLAFFTIGFGVQLHYTFAAIIFPVFITLLLFCYKALFSFRFWSVAFLGLIIPLLPFLLGQYLNGYQDIEAIRVYLFKAKDKSSIDFFSSLVSRLKFIYQIYYRVDYLPWYFNLLILPSLVLMSLTSFLISFSKTHLQKPTTIFLIFFIVGILIANFRHLPTYWHYHANFSIFLILLISVTISFLYKFAKIPFVWFPLFALFFLWQVSFLSESYKVVRSPQIVYKVAEEIINDADNKKAPFGILVITPLGLREGFEYRYILERSGLLTFSAPSLDEASYVIVEKPSEGVKIDTERIFKKLKYKKIKDINNKESTTIKSAEIFRI